MKRGNTKKILSLLLAVAMVFTMLPVTVMAAPGDEQFNLTPGGTYYFDLTADGTSALSIPGTVNATLPDTGLKWVPFTYAGTVNAYSLDASSIGVPTSSVDTTPSDRSLFVADHNVSHTVSWDSLHSVDLIFGTPYTAGGVDYTLRSLSVGSPGNGEMGAAARGMPETNEWDQLLNKDGDSIKNWSGIYSWGQDSHPGFPSDRAVRGRQSSARYWSHDASSIGYANNGFRPALEILNPGTLGADGLKTVTYDMDGNGKLGGGSLEVATVVYTGTLTLPAVTPANGFNYTGSPGTGILGWYDGTAFYAPGTEFDSLSNGTVLTAGYGVETVTEQFNLTPGGTYYFNLTTDGTSALSIPGEVNTALPDTGLKWVPFTYAGTVKAYSLDASSSGDVSASAAAAPSNRSLFVADYNVSRAVSWNSLNAAGLIFGKAYTADGVDYSLRSLSVGSASNGQSGNDERGTPLTNEWDQVLNKNETFIKNWSGILTWGQDTQSTWAEYRTVRGYSLARIWTSYSASGVGSDYGFRPALEILNPGTLGVDGLKTVTYDMDDGGTLGSGSLSSATMVYTGTLTLPSVTSANGFNYTGGSGTGTLGWYDGATFYAPGTSLASLPNGTVLTAGYGVETVTEQFDLTPGGTYYFNLTTDGTSALSIPGTVNTALPDTGLKWVPFTYAGTVKAYSLDASSSGSTTASASATTSERSMFVADYNVAHTVSWDGFHSTNLIFGRAYTAGGIDYTLRSLSAGSDDNGQSGAAMRGAPETNEWDQLLNKDGNFIKNWSGMYIWGQDTDSSSSLLRAARGHSSARYWGNGASIVVSASIGFRPALEILNPAALGSDGLKTVTYDMDGNGTLGSGSLESATVVYTGTLTLPAVTSANGFNYTGSPGTGILGWYDGTTFYAPGTEFDSLSNGTVLTAGYGVETVTEQFNLTPGGTYYFNLTTDGTSALSIPGTVNTALPDTGLKWVPFTYAGTVKAYSLDASSSGSTTASASATPSERSMFVADYNVSNHVHWNQLNTAGLIFGKNYSGGGINYTLRSLSAGSSDNGQNGANIRGLPETNEWDQLLNKDGNFIKNWSGMYIWGQDISSSDPSFRVRRGNSSARNWNPAASWIFNLSLGFRPALEILNPAGLGADGLKTVTYDMGGNGTLGSGSLESATVVYTGSLTLPEITAANGFNYTGSGTGTLGWHDGTTFYAPGTVLASLPNGTILTPAQESHAINVQNDGNGTASASPSTAVAGTEITLTATPDTGYQFKEWQVVSGGVTITANKFTMPDEPVTVRATFEEIPATAYTVTVQNDGNGTASASPSTAVAGTEITLTAAPNTGYQFKEWQVISGGITITANKFTMPDQPVTVRAIFEEIPATAYAVTVNGSYAGTTGAGSYTQGAAVTIHAGNRSGYSFAGWTSDHVTVANAGSKDTGFVMPGHAVTVTANWSYNGGGSSGGGGTPSTPPASNIAPEKQPDMPTVAETNVSGKGKDHVLTAVITEQMAKDAIHAAQNAAKKTGRETYGIAVDFNITGSGSYISLNVTIDAEAINRLKEAGVRFIRIGSSVLDVTLDTAAIEELDRQSTGIVTISAKAQTKLSKAAKKLIGSRPVFDITVSYQKSGKTEYVTSFGKGTVTLGIAYRATGKEMIGWLFGVYVDDKGNASRILGSAFDVNSGSLILNTNHLSVYGVGYEVPTEKYTDIASHWAKESIDYMVGRRLFSGTTEKTFSPNMAMDRGMLVTVLGRLADADVSAYKTSSFSDVAAGKYYLPYVEWAYKNGIISGIGGGKFAPERAVTREEIALILQNYTKATGYKLPVTREVITFADASSIGSSYRLAVKAMQQAGIMMGENGNRFNPKAGATRAEFASMLHRYVKLTIDPATAQGWAKNDDGRYMYYKDGKPLTGTQTIDGVKYNFFTNGTLQTGWVKDGDNWRFYSGNRALVGWWNIGSETSKKRYYFDVNAVMVFGKWLQIDGKWYYFYTDGALAVSTKIDGYEVDENGVRKDR